MTEDLAGRVVVTLDLDGVTDKAGLMDRAARALALPDWFGRNWDALADSLGDEALWPAGAARRGLLVVVRGWQAYAEARPKEWETAREVFSASVRPSPALDVALALGGSSRAPAGGLDVPPGPGGTPSMGQ
ncbi:barstar family protein [Streptomyces sp. TG1A-8]|uniref:barstar family protein n=1 Tax=Streptomyces sp. TG1A-8 TaxID=3051385 RepID=UPI00265B942C|nr:barstar family protein [Streptomyces sp. TG1A-8]MDO0928652.1 barstar family protein [Streptomyces sp. TG1A-8]